MEENSPLFIDAQRQNRRRRYSISSPSNFESRAGRTVQQSDIDLHRLSRRTFSKTYSISSDFNRLFPLRKSSTEKYDILSKLNLGAFGATYLIRDSIDGHVYILKRINYNLPEQFRERLFEERRLLGCLKSNYLLALMSSYTDMEHQCYSMKFEYVSGRTLKHLVRQWRWLEEATVAFYSAQIVLAFEYLHELNIIYRNLKLESILLVNNGYIKLSDFAFAKLLSSHSSHTYSLVGVPDIIPPEMLLGQPYSFSVDWWQLGIAIFEMFTSTSPFFARSMLQTHRNVLCNHRREFPGHMSSLARQICSMLLQMNVKQRLGCSSTGRDAKEVKDNLWFRSQIDWTTIIERSHPAPYQINDCQIDSKENFSMINTIESKWLDEYDQAVRSLMDVSLNEDSCHSLSEKKT